MKARPAVLGVALAASAAPGGAVAGAPGTRLIELPSAATLLPVPPPLNPPRAAPTQPILPVRGVRVRTDQVVSVAATPSGALQAVRVDHTLDVRGTGDYTFAIPAPVIDVVAGPKSESAPGRRDNEIVWKGFAPGRKRLAARAFLRPNDAAPALPVRVAVAGAPTRPGSFAVEVVVANVTRAEARVYGGDAVASDVATALDALARAAAHRAQDPQGAIRLRDRPVPSPAAVTATLSLAGTIHFPAGSVRDLAAAGARVTVRGTSVRFSALTGGHEPEVVRIRLTGVANRVATPSVRIVAAPDEAAALPRPPGRTWTAALREGRLAGNGRQLLARAFRAKLEYERTRQYEAFLGSPAGPNLLGAALGPSRTAYVFRTVPAKLTRPASGASTGRDDDGASVPAALVVAGALLVGAGLVVLWAHL